MSTDIIDDVKIDENIRTIDLEPNKYKIVMLDDDQTPMEWVTEILTTTFKHSQTTAEKIMLSIHNDGTGIVGIYTYEIAEQKVHEAVNASRDQGFPLGILMEKE